MATGSQRARRAVRWTVAALVVAAAMAPAAASARPVLPDVIALPPGWQPEGIAEGRGRVMYSGSRATGDILAVDVVTGETRLVVDAPAGRVALGLEEDRFGRLWVAGGATGQAYVYDADGTPLETFQLGSPSETFVNDVVLTADAAWFTDSRRPVLYRIPIGPGRAIGEPQVVPLTGDYQHQTTGLNLNGIDATPGDRWLIAVQSSTGILYRIDPGTGEAVRIDLGGAQLTNGDGVLVQGRTVYVVRNRLNRVAVVELDRGFTSGRVVGELTSPNFDVPTTIAAFGSRFYLVNARFSTPATPSTPYTMVAIRRR